MFDLYSMITIFRDHKLVKNELTPVYNGNLSTVWTPPIGATVDNYPEAGQRCEVKEVMFDFGEDPPRVNDKPVVVAIVMEQIQ